MGHVSKFFSAFIANRKVVGAIAPSSQGLARAMDEALGPLDDSAWIVEFGPGTGVFTETLRRNRPTANILAIEFSSEFISLLNDRFAHDEAIHIVQGCASRAAEFLAERGVTPEKLGGVVSGLPMLSLPAPIRDPIFASLTNLIPPTRRYVQFTYSKTAWRGFELEGFHRQTFRQVWWNLPPASVLVFTRHD